MTAPARELKPGAFQLPSRSWLWLAVAALSLLSIDWWVWDSTARLGGWLPHWLLWLIVLQFALALVLWRLGREAEE